MFWWRLSGSANEVTGDEATDVAAGLLEPMMSFTPRPALDEFLDGLEAAVEEVPRVASDGLQGRRIVVGEIPRRPGQPRGDVASALRPGLEALRETYRRSFRRPPTMREILEAISRVLRARPGRYLCDAPIDELNDDLVAEPIRCNQPEPTDSEPRVRRSREW